MVAPAHRQVAIFGATIVVLVTNLSFLPVLRVQVIGNDESLPRNQGLSNSDRIAPFEIPIRDPNYGITFPLSTYNSVQVNWTDVHGDTTTNDRFRHSQKWLDGPRLANINETRMTNTFVENLIYGASFLSANNGSEHLLKHTICPADSRFLHWHSLNESTKHIATLTKRLIYLAIHEHQHKPAKAEALARGLMMQKTNITINQTYIRNHGVGPFDFECDPDTKYIVTSIPSRRGFGVNFRGFGVEPIMLGLMMNRVALYINSLGFGPVSLRQKFFYSDCPRKDMQCMFMPLSPCVLTHDDILHGAEMSAIDLDIFRSTGVLDEKYRNAKVLVVQTDNLKVHPKEFGKIVIEKIKLLFQSQVESNHEMNPMLKPWQLDNKTFEEVNSYISNPRNQWELWEAAAMYGMRPNSFLQGEIDKVLGNILPHDFNSKTSIGIPIRDGDKCIRESQCMSFAMYMQLAQEMATKRTHQRRAQEGENSAIYDQELLYNTIMVSSDSKSMINARFNYTTNNSFPFRIIANDWDIGQGHGKPAFFTDANAVMISSMVALKMQLHPETLIYNSCSNFHKLITLFFKGCGRSEDGHYESLLENDNKAFHMKCAW